VFSQPKIEDIFRQRYVTLRLHADRVPAGSTQVPDARGARDFRDEKFNNKALPYYVIVQPHGQTLYETAVYDKTLITDTDDFVRFLDRYAVWQNR
jgi:hypothetical protein